VKAVVDTNVVVSRYIAPGGTPARIMNYWEASAFQLLVSDSILVEYDRVLRYPRLVQRHHMDEIQIRRVVRRFRRFGVLCSPTESLSVVPNDPSDDKFLECAVAGEADFVVSGDPHLLDLRRFRGIEIVSPDTFLALIDRAAKERPQ
jgi:putative PIN family toxin of toxin-antitoxin system